MAKQSKTKINVYVFPLNNSILMMSMSPNNPVLLIVLFLLLKILFSYKTKCESRDLYQLQPLLMSA